VRSDWTKHASSNANYERYGRRDGMAVSCSLDIPPGDDWRVFRETPFAYLSKQLPSAEAAMDYADKHYPMEREG
jgi:hypothetical protein